MSCINQHATSLAVLNIDARRIGFVELRTLSGRRDIDLHAGVPTTARGTHSMTVAKPLGQFPRHIICNNHRGHGRGLPQRHVDAPNLARLGPTHLQPAPRASGFFMLRHCDRSHPCYRPPTSLLGPGRGSSRAVLRLRIYLPVAGLNVSRRQSWSRSEDERRKP